jgi:hypothetical protein
LNITGVAITVCGTFSAIVVVLMLSSCTETNFARYRVVYIPQVPQVDRRDHTAGYAWQPDRK